AEGADGARHREPRGADRGTAARTRSARSRSTVATAIPPATRMAEPASLQPMGSPITSAVARTPKRGVVRLNAARPLGRYVLRRDMLAMKLNPAITTPW